MNFKPIWLKSIVSIAVGFLSDLVLTFQFKFECMPVEEGIGTCSLARYSQIFDPFAIFIWIFNALIIYLIWSLIQEDE